MIQPPLKNKAKKKQHQEFIFFPSKPVAFSLQTPTMAETSSFETVKLSPKNRCFPV
uniref:Uncharacterized protein n=1 Tax=Anguilla anguilla TaxID=7936 RepID=A0A0E9S8G8_ANGAN